MKTITAAFLLVVFTAALQIGQLHFVDVGSAQDYVEALKEGPVLIYIHQPHCQGCEYLKAEVFTDERVAVALSDVNLISLDLSKYLVRNIEVVADGQVYIYSRNSLHAQRISGRQNIPVLGTPMVIMGHVKNGTLHVALVMIGPADPDTFLRLVETAYRGQASAPQQQAAASENMQSLVQIALSFAAGVISVFSPCVLPVLTIAATTYLARRSLSVVLMGMAVSYAAIATVITVAATWVGKVASTALYVTGGVLLILMGSVLVVERLNKAFVIWASRFQTSVYRTSRRGVGKLNDFVLGASLSAVWTPCIAPFFGAVVAANLMASAISGNYLILFVATLAYAAGLALVIYLLVNTLRRSVARVTRDMKWGALGRKIEYAVGIISIVLGTLLLGEAFGLSTFSTLFKL